jgi:hypothetical protein
VRISPESVEFRRQIKFIFVSRIEFGPQVGVAAASEDAEMASDDKAQSLSDAKKSSKKRKNK